MWGLLRRRGSAAGELGLFVTFAAVAACVLGAEPAIAHTDGVRRAATIHIYATVQPVAPSDPRWAPPTLNGEADFRVTFSTSPPSCATLTALMTVTGPNAQTKVNQVGGGVMGYLGKKPGVDTVTFTFSLSNCSGTADYDVIANPPTVFSVGWGQDAWSKGARTAKGRPAFEGRQWRYYHRKQCVEDPIDEETGAFQTAASDVQLPSPVFPLTFAGPTVRTTRRRTRIWAGAGRSRTTRR